MQCGISTSCFYPQETAEALSALRGAGVETVEIFLNTFSELELSYTERLRSVLQDAGMRAAALHPFTSGMETFFFASEYGGRLEDGLRIYRRYFEVCRVLGIPRVVFHGFKGIAKIICCCAGQRGNMALISVRKTWCAANAACRNMCVKCGNIRGTMSHLFWM